MKVTDLFGNEHELKEPGANQLPGRNKSGGYLENPMHLVYGKIEGEKCKNCTHLVAKRYSKTYYKCELRQNVNKTSTKSDHKVNWTACEKFEKDKD
jgi:hypothetical protein